jgi:hypothetical protein
MDSGHRIDRRTTLKWVLAAAGAMAGALPVVYGWEEEDSPGSGTPTAKGYGTDPDLSKVYKAGDVWPLTLTGPQRETARVLCDLILPADSVSPSASEVGVVDFIDEWISAPYKKYREDRTLVLEGLGWLDTEAAARYGAQGPSSGNSSPSAAGSGSSREPSILFAALSPEQQTAICDDICLVEKAQPQLVKAAKFFARYRDLTAGGFYTTPQGRQDLRYVGNVPLTKFDGPPLEVLKKVGLA